MTMKWQPIETAPKDFTIKILLTDGTDIVLAHFEEDEQIWEYYDYFRECILRYCPTHWMPLPEAPKKETN